MPEKWKVKLRSDQRKKLLRIVHAGKHKAREILYAHSLLKAAKGWKDANIADAFATSTQTVQRTRQRFVEAGLQAALTEEPRPGQPTKLTPEQEILLIALACRTPPAGFQRWTVRLLTSEAIARQIVPKSVPETAHQILKKTNSSPGKLKGGVTPTSHPTSSRAGKTLWHCMPSRTILRVPPSVLTSNPCNY